jgi:predicted ATPase/class 3 adenylate cyclase
MAALPTGTVTFLFTDIEGSTRLLEQLGDSYAEALAGHRRVLRSAFADYGGAEVDTQGDAFFIAFARASDAVAAAAAAQRALSSGPIQVRMGIHTGEPLRTDDGYVGMDIHRGARIAASGHGGQVLISQTARELVQDDLPEEFALRDLGEHRLKDLSRPQRIFQLVTEGLEGEFPPLATLENRPTNLPPQPTSLIGRERELAEVVELMRRPEVRMLTLTGPGGAGKTRLALQAAADLLDDFGDGVFFVALAGVAELSLVVPTIAQAVGIRETGGLAPEEALERFLHERELLLVLDNLEHLLDAAPQVSDLVLKAPSLKAIASSRAPLRISVEREYPVPELVDRDAVALFRERAQAIKPDFHLNGDAPAVIEICRRLDGLPLAIELAAARAKVLSPAALLERLDQRLPVLTGGARDLPDRQRTLRDTIAWSYELLDEDEQSLFSRLALFMGGFTLAAAEHVCDADLDALTSLVEKSLVRQGEDRFRMLETIREFARERLDESGEIQEIGRRHIEFFLELAGSGGSEAQPDTSEWLDRLDPERDNLRAALNLARELGDPRLELRLATTLAGYWEYRSYLREGLERIQEALDRDPEAPVEIRSEALRRGSLIALRQGDGTTARQMAEQMSRLCAESDDQRGVANAYTLIGVIATFEGQYGDARIILERARSMHEQLRDETGLAAALHDLGLLAMDEGDFERARAEIESGMSFARTLGREWRIANSLCDLGFAELGGGRLDEARERFQEAHSLAARMGWTENVAYCLVGFSALALAADELEAAGKLLGQVDRLVEDIHLRFLTYAERVRTDVESELRLRLGEDRLEACRADGAALSMEAVMVLID